MSENITFSNGLLPLEDSNEKTRVFIPSKNINIFPCSRRGQFGIETVDAEGKPITVKANGDPEARLNTERTNRLRTSINGFTDSFIVNDNFVSGATLTFTLAGYRIEVKEFDPAIIATALGTAFVDAPEATIYAHLSLHDGIPFGVANYYTEILYRQATNAANNYIDVEYTDGSTKSDFFMGVSFTSYEADDTIEVNDATKQLKKANLPLFSKVDGNWKLVEASKLPKVEHDTEPDSIKLSGDFTVNHSGTASFKVIKDSNTSKTTINTTELEVTGKAVINGATTLQNTLEVADKVTAKNGLEVSNSDLKVTNGTLTVNKNITTEIGDITAANGTTTTKDLIVSNSAKITGELQVGGKAALDNGLEVTNGDTVLKKLSAGETSLDSLAIAGEAADGSTLTVNGTTTITDDLAVSGTTSAPTLKVDTITTNANSEITVESSLKVTGKATLTDELEVTKKATLNNGLKVANGDTDLRKLAATELKVATDALTITKDEAKFKKPVTVDNSLTANNVQIKDQGQVPALELYHFKNGPYQLRFKFNTAPTIIEEK